jgi:nascent polypeptide-associated complex subunit alpha
MMPGMRGVNPRQMKQAMKRMGISQDEWDDVEEVIIRRPGKTYVFRKPSVTAITMQGQMSFQIAGDHEIVEGPVQVSKAPAAPKRPEIPQEDIDLVASQANVSKEEALKALEECNGEPAEAIIKLMGK